MTDVQEIDYQRRFGGIARLYGVHGLEAFRKANVCVVGIGGIGSWAVEALARSGIGEITLIDLDHVAESNINRQIHALESQIGKAKVEAMAERIREINPQCRINCIEEFVETGNLDRLITSEYSYVIDCIDVFKTKTAFIAHCHSNGINVVTVGGAGGQTDPLKVRLADLSRTQYDPLLKKMRKQLRKDHNFPRNLKKRFKIPCVYSDELPVYPDAFGGVCHDKPHKGVSHGLNCGGYGSVTPVTATFGLVAVSHVLRKLEEGNRKQG
ncbi:MAG: tRNA cyclic N6-threonylcarbamoyladenosine(37) synthase TcdA [Candidatus Sedimenticola sp. (ex Thyasira tokunagai)]